MTGFLQQVAERLYHEYGDGISSLRILLPNRRARLFFSDALASITESPVWQPDYISIDDVMGEFTDLKAGDHVRLMVELYKVYSAYHQESFDSFYFWGEMLLSDFDSIDKYMVDARMLFSNISDLKELENDRSYLTDEQKQIIIRFWKSFGPDGEDSDEKKRFVSIWRTLYDIYREYRTRLRNNGIAYGGMIYRDVAEKLKIIGKTPVMDESSCAVVGSPAGKDKQYVIAGFNALSECEKVLFDHLARYSQVDFFWDYDNYYVDDPEQEAGLFLRDNIRRYPQRLALPYDNNGFSDKKNICVVAALSDSMQCKYAAEFLENIAGQSSERIQPGKETAIVLTDENLLIPLLYSIPSDVKNINVTMGYPLHTTVAYSFVERLIELQNRRKTIRGNQAFYHSDVTGLLSHPYISGHVPDAEILLESLTEKQSIYIHAAELGDADMIRVVFSDAGDGWQPLSEYLIKVVSAVMRCEGDVQQVEYLSVIADNINKLSNSLDGCGVEITGRIYASVLRKMLQGTSVPFEGEPLQGVQVMGILETRNLDFENVLLLSANDDNFPGNRAVSASFIPNNLRIAYGLPTPRHHEGVYAYYFYRLLQRAKNIHIVYNSTANSKSGGEPSRYVYQLRFESPHDLAERNIGVDVAVEEAQPIVVEKDSRILTRLDGFTHGEALLSPTSLYNFIACPMKFYFRSIARLEEAAEISEDVDAPMFGSILHFAMRCLYEPLVGLSNPQVRIDELIGTECVEEAVNRAITEEFFHGSATDPKEYSGNLVMIQDIVSAYINKCILPFDAAQKGFVIRNLEEKIECSFALDDGRKVGFGGMADRIDKLDDGRLRVVDYKTGREQLSFAGVGSLFSGVSKELNSGVLQTLLYSMILKRKYGYDVQPALYYVREMGTPDYSPLLQDRERKVPVWGYEDVAEPFEMELREVLKRLFDVKEPFGQCEDRRVCEWCDYNVLCRR